MCFNTRYLVAQDPIFSQFYAAPMQLNPALAGQNDGGKAAVNYRNQWPGIHQAYVTYAASYDQFFSSFNSGLGISLLADDAGRGLYRTSVADLSYSYRLRSRNFEVRMGISVGYLDTRINWSKLVFSDQLDPEYGYESPGGLTFPTDDVPPEMGNRLNAINLSTGLVLSTDQFYAGVSFKHLNSPSLQYLPTDEGFEIGLPVGISLHAGAELDLIKGSGRNAFISPNVQFVAQGAQSQLNVGTVFRYYKVGTGVWYRHSSTNPDALIFLVEGRHENYRIAYSYDFNLSKLSGSGGAHEISFMINFEGKPNESRYNDCFNLFR